MAEERGEGEMKMEVNTKALARQLAELRKELEEKHPELSDKYDCSLMVASSIFENIEELER